MAVEVASLMGAQTPCVWLGSNLSVVAVTKAARPSLSTQANPPSSGE